MARSLPTESGAIRGPPRHSSGGERAERWEEQWIAQLGRPELPLAVRGVAFRSIMELRGATARDAASFLGVEPRVIVLGLSLLEVPRTATPHEAPAALSRKSHSRRTKAA